MAFLNWFDESPDALHDFVASIAFCDHLVAVDGAYALFPDGRGRSAREQHLALLDATAAARIPLTLHLPEETWPGNEVQKTGFILRLVRQVAGRADWVLGIDADERISSVEEGRLRASLGSSELDVAECWLHGTGPDDEPFGWPIRRLFRVLPQLTLKGAHFLFTGLHPQRRVWLGNHPDRSLVEDALDVTSLLRIEHRNRGTSNDVRSPQRVEAQLGYYNARERLGIERLNARGKR